MSITQLGLLVLLSCLLIVAGCTSEHPFTDDPTAATTENSARTPQLRKSGKAFPGIIPLPNGFQPEGIVVGNGTTFFVGSLVDGSIYRGDLRTGAGNLLVDEPEGDRIAVGLAFDQRIKLLFVAGGPIGEAYVYDAESGETAATYQLTEESNTFINDVIVTRTAAFFTDSFRPFIYRIPLGPAGQLPDSDAVEELALDDDDDFEAEPGVFKANGIDATPNGKHLIVVNTTLRTLYRVDPETGEAQLIDLDGDTVPNGDGILLDGRTLYVVQNFLNQIAVVELSPNLLSGQVTGTITSPDFRIPTTVAEFGSDLYAVNARFDVPDPIPNTEYDVVRVDKE